ncbi:YcxB family protein [Planococcus sp. YIM B11945]|uniref:YcxB family protein n=1 Tax=Planococcus sp. YIM B11945 TaxID=3435410 RepID=UPI003D7DF0DA
MEINYRMTEEALVHFNVFHAKNSKTVKKSLKLQQYLTPVFYLLIAFFLSVIWDTPFLYLAIPFLAMGILWAFFYPAYFYWRIKKTARKMVREGKNEGLIGEYSMAFTEDGLQENSPKGTTSTSWSGIEQFGEDEVNFYLYNSTMSAFIVPKNELQDVDQVRVLLRRRIER